MIEKVYDITLDLTYYGGQDLYSDGSIEDELLQMVTEHEEDELNGLIKERFSWPAFYHFSPIRQNIVTWLPIRKDQDVLEIGAGCGAITGALANMAEHVTCIELSKKRSLINANRNKAYDNIEIKVGNFTDIEPNLTEKYDYITLIGVFEYAEAYIKSENPYHGFLKRIEKHLKPDGKIVIAIENRLGLKYIAGCMEDHTGKIGEGLNHYPTSTGVRTYDKKELEEIFTKAGFADFTFYYPYPDYKLPLAIYSDEYLPKAGSLTQNQNNLDQPRVSFFDEKDAWDKVLEWGIFDELSNSYAVILNHSSESKSEEKVLYAEFSNDRTLEHAKMLRIVSDAAGERHTQTLALGAHTSKQAEKDFYKLETVKQDHNKAVMDINQLFTNQEIVQLREETERLRQHIEILENSTSWKITKPIRSILDWLRQKKNSQD